MASIGRSVVMICTIDNRGPTVPCDPRDCLLELRQRQRGQCSLREFRQFVVIIPSALAPTAARTFSFSIRLKLQMVVPKYSALYEVQYLLEIRHGQST
ncbi:hypothetical protein KIN20_027507 [Parelaphostrongylus tenuis]|uniref:Uncharacterized protein n=1 Tax=Parelaphostrongylus tenuis TaxID=148309 RepID=A0AAD5QZJ3_PARTN|nr:hypothetical protein KIN20_027507 [Parelaphostrongylus tenuis]